MTAHDHLLNLVKVAYRPGHRVRDLMCLSPGYSTHTTIGPHRPTSVMPCLEMLVEYGQDTAGIAVALT